MPGIQETFAVILWRLDTVARDWVPVRGLALPGSAAFATPLGEIAVDQEAVARLRTGEGRHEFALTEDSRYAFVTNAADLTLSVVDVKELKQVKTLKTSGRPVAVAYSGQSKAVYVASEDGKVLVVDGKTHRAVRLWLSLGPKRVSIPRVEGESVRTARAALQQAGVPLARAIEVRSTDRGR